MMVAQAKKYGLKIMQGAANQTAMDLPRNMANNYTLVRKAVEEGADVLALEELGVTGYEANDGS